jgi:hypothetical protein
MSGLLAASLAMWAAGCATRTEAPDPAPPTNPDRKATDTDRKKPAKADQKAAPDGAVSITVEVKGMTKALGPFT